MQKGWLSLSCLFVQENGTLDTDKVKGAFHLQKHPQKDYDLTMKIIFFSQKNMYLHDGHSYVQLPVKRHGY